jgi:hypothetical protein
VVGQHADDLDVAAREADLFLGFAQRGLDGEESSSSARPPGKLTWPA